MTRLSTLIKVQNTSFGIIVGHFGPNFDLILAENAQFLNFSRHVDCTE